MKKIKVVASGSGTLLYYHIGVLKRLVETFDIEEIIGTSGGAFILAFLATGYSISDIEGIAKFEKLSNCVDSSWNFFDKFGIVEGNKILKVLEKYLTKTFSETKIPFTAVVTDFNEKKPIYFSTKNTPNEKISLIIRASMSIPLFFKYVLWNNKILVDGGLCNNFPIDFFKNNKNVIGIKVESSWNRDNGLKNWFLNFLGINYIIDLISIMMNSLEKKHIEDSIYSNIIVIKSNRSGLSFDFTLSDIDEMINEGYLATNEFLKTWQS
jgi:NTE family protein